MASSAPAAAATGSTACDSATGRALLVGPGRTYATPSAAAAAARAGDVIQIAAGDYAGDVATWSADDLTICGSGGRAVLYAAGKNTEGKGIWVIRGANVVIDGIDFHDAAVPDLNGAGIRAEGGGKLTVRNSGFFGNENGILGGDKAELVSIDHCEFASNGHGDGQSHNIYIGFANRLLVTSSYFHEAKIGHNFKSRARTTRIENSYFMDGPDGTSSYLANFPSGGVVYLRGNLFQKGPKADNSTAIAYGEEGLHWSTNTLEMVHNTVVMTRSGGSFIKAAGAPQAVVLVGNLFAGLGNPELIGSRLPAGSILQQGNVISLASSFSGADDLAAPDFWPSARLLAQIGLAKVLDPSYVDDAPRPFATRAIVGGARMAGALQAKP